ncbi:hypothetical protein F443_15522 [Phytophthora nicotianae P1569]|uniref:Uncharacterized protein n=1 Tax=Phytophthora nicotianae P1569 TaxID=1317065 RepID=V9EIJ2_PHYNI|nr:hypothetical protein F443_15522 [Phytophthora nicotianae P1569]
METNNASDNTATLSQRFIKIDVLQSCDNAFSFLREHRLSYYPVFAATEIPANLDIMTVLMRHNAKFDFPTQQSRDSIAPLLTSWLLCVAPSDAQKLLVHLLSSGAVCHKLHHVVLALT